MITRNSARCTACGVEIESTHRHDFAIHTCDVEPTPGKKWVDGKLVPSGQMTWRFAVDGGKDYLKRSGHGFEETSIYDET